MPRGKSIPKRVHVKLTTSSTIPLRGSKLPEAGACTICVNERVVQESKEKRMDALCPPHSLPLTFILPFPFNTKSTDCI